MCRDRFRLTPNAKMGKRCLHDHFTHCEKAVQALHDHFAHCEKAAQALHDHFTHCEKAVQALHGHFAHCEKAVQALHDHFTHCEKAMQALHDHFTHCEKAVQALHSHFTHCEKVERPPIPPFCVCRSSASIPTNAAPPFRLYRLQGHVGGSDWRKKNAAHREANLRSGQQHETNKDQLHKLHYGISTFRLTSPKVTT